MSHKIRYTQGPDNLQLGTKHLWKGEFAHVDEADARQAMLPERVAEYGFECDPPLPDQDDGFEEGDKLSVTTTATSARQTGKAAAKAEADAKAAAEAEAAAKAEADAKAAAAAAGGDKND